MRNKNKFEGIMHSESVIIERLDENTVKIEITKPTSNMQDDSACFESLALMCKCNNANECIDLKFTILEDFKYEFGHMNKATSTYVRFLYRMLKFKQAFDWVSITDENCKKALDKFQFKIEDAIKNGALSNNIPQKEDLYNEEKGEEHIIEKKLTSSLGFDYLNTLYESKTGTKLILAYNQLPNGLFNIESSGKAREDNRIFTTGFYDIWGIDEKGKFCVFELKKNQGNEHLGVISELFFYAIYAKEILCNKDRLAIKRKKANYRGYGDLYDAVNEDKITGINAIFLFGNGVYSLIEKNETKLLELMNENSFEIKFDILRYDADKISDINI